MDTLDAALRLVAATVAGALFGLNRDMEQTGVRTLGLVGLGSAMAAARIGGGDVSGAIQGMTRSPARRCRRGALSFRLAWGGDTHARAE